MNQFKIGIFIKQLREEMGLERKDIAEKLSVDEKIITKWEQGKVIPKNEQILALCNFFNISVNELISGCRLDEKNYKSQSENNLLELIKEKNENIKKIFTTSIVLFITLIIGIALIVVSDFAVGSLKIIFVASGLIVALVGIAICCILDQGTGYYQCRHCGEFFVPKMGAYIMGAHTITTRLLKCPHCGKVSWCKRRLSK